MPDTPQLSPFLERIRKGFFHFVGYCFVVGLGFLWLAGLDEGFRFGRVMPAEVVAPAHLEGFEWVAFPGPNGTVRDAYEARVAFETEGGERFVVNARSLGAFTSAQTGILLSKRLEAVYREDAPGMAEIRVHHRIPVQKLWFFPIVFLGLIPVLSWRIQRDFKLMWRRHKDGR